MSEQNLNEERYNIPTNDLEEAPDKSGGLLGKSSIKEVIEAASGIDPSRFWIVFMVALILSLAAVVTLGGGYLVEQGKAKDKEILTLRQEIKDCPEKTLDDFRKQQETIDALRRGVINDSERIQQIKSEKINDLQKLEVINKQVTKELK